MTLADKFSTMIDITTIEETISYYHKNKHIDSGMQIGEDAYVFFFTDDSIYFKSDEQSGVCTKEDDPVFYKTINDKIEEAKKKDLMNNILRHPDYTIAYSFEVFLQQHRFTGFNIAAAVREFKNIELIEREVIDKRISFIGFIDHSIYMAAPGEGGAIFHEDDIGKLMAVLLELKEGARKESFAELKKIEAHNVRPPQKETA